MTFEQYRADDFTPQDTWADSPHRSVSKSLIVSYLDDAKAWRQSVKKKQTLAMKKGSLFDALLTDEANFDDLYVLSPYADFRTNEAKAWRDTNNKEVITQAQLQDAQDQRAAVMDHEAAAKLIKHGQFQVPFFHGTKHPFRSKGLIDLIPLEPRTIVDVKTCQAGALDSIRSLQRHIVDFGYHIQAGAYSRGYTLATGNRIDTFKFIFVTSTRPFRVAVIEMHPNAVHFGNQIYQRGMDAFAMSLETDVWPSKWDGTNEIDLPEYTYND